MKERDISRRAVFSACVMGSIAPASEEDVVVGRANRCRMEHCVITTKFYSVSEAVHIRVIAAY